MIKLNVLLRFVYKITKVSIKFFIRQHWRYPKPSQPTVY